MPFTVAIYMTDMAYGGPEEGGWWYEYGIPVEELAQHTRGFKREHDARKYADKLHKTVVETLNQGRREISSVLSEGRYAALWFEGMPKPYPGIKPYYE